MAGGAGPSFAIRGAGPSLSLVGGAGPSSFFVGGVAGRWSHCSWVVVVCPRRIICEWWWWCTLVGFPAARPPSLSWWSCRHSRERVVGRSCLRTLHPLSSCVGILHRFRVPSSRILVVMCPCCCHVSLVIVVCPRCVVVPCPPRCYPVMLLLPCPHCDMSFDCHVAVGNMAPVVKR